jgi:hypothetical protein
VTLPAGHARRNNLNCDQNIEMKQGRKTGIKKKEIEI